MSFPQTHVPWSQHIGQCMTSWIWKKIWGRKDPKCVWGEDTDFSLNIFKNYIYLQVTIRIPDNSCHIMTFWGLLLTRNVLKKTSNFEVILRKFYERLLLIFVSQMTPDMSQSVLVYLFNISERYRDRGWDFTCLTQQPGTSDLWLYFIFSILVHL